MTIDEIRAKFVEMREDYEFDFTKNLSKEFSLIRRGAFPVAVIVCSVGMKNNSCFLVITTVETTCTIDEVTGIEEEDGEIVIRGVKSQIAISKRCSN